MLWYYSINVISGKRMSILSNVHGLTMSSNHINFRDTYKEYAIKKRNKTLKLSICRKGLTTAH